VQCRACLVQDGGEGLDDVGNPGRDLQGDLHVAGGGAGCQPDGIIEQDLIGPALDEEWRKTGQVGETGLARGVAGSVPAR
jgi:hypothetical protein